MREIWYAVRTKLFGVPLALTPKRTTNHDRGVSMGKVGVVAVIQEDIRAHRILKAPSETQAIQYLVAVCVHLRMLIANVPPALIGQVDRMSRGVRGDVLHVWRLPFSPPGVKVLPPLEEMNEPGYKSLRQVEARSHSVFQVAVFYNAQVRHAFNPKPAKLTFEQR